jgi:sec-independent protein translocase protein TatA
MFRNPYADGIIVLVILLLFFGPKRLPTLGRSLGTGLREFKTSITGESSGELDDEHFEISKTSAQPAQIAQPVAPAAAAPVAQPAVAPAPQPVAQPAPDQAAQPAPVAQPAPAEAAPAPAGTPADPAV